MPPIQFKNIGFDPSQLPPWITKIAMDQDGEWKVFRDTPTLKRDFWQHKYSLPIPPEHAPKNYTGCWTKSLHDISLLTI